MYRQIATFKTERETGTSLHSQRLLELLLGTEEKLANSWAARHL